MKAANVYLDLKGRVYSLHHLDSDEQRLIQTFKRLAKENPDWAGYRNLFMTKVADFYKKRKLSRPEIVNTLVFQIGQDIGSRLAVAAGLARVPDYREQIEHLIQTKFASRRAFCRATGISEDMLSHVLARRKHLALDSLEHALNKIGYSLQIVPRPPAEAS